MGRSLPIRGAGWDGQQGHSHPAGRTLVVVVGTVMMVVVVTVLVTVYEGVFSLCVRDSILFQWFGW